MFVIVAFQKAAEWINLTSLRYRSGLLVDLRRTEWNDQTNALRCTKTKQCSEDYVLRNKST